MASGRSGDGETAFKLLTASWFYALMGQAFRWCLVPRNTGDFRLMDRKACGCALLVVRNANVLSAGWCPGSVFSQKGILYHRDARYAGETKYTLQKMLRFAVVGITSFSDKPLWSL